MDTPAACATSLIPATSLPSFTGEAVAGGNASHSHGYCPTIPGAAAAGTFGYRLVQLEPDGGFARNHSSFGRIQLLAAHQLGGCLRLSWQWQRGLCVIGYHQHVAVGEGQDIVLGAFDPVQRTGAQCVILAQLQQAAVQVQRGGLVINLRVAGVGIPVRWLRQPAFAAVTEAIGRLAAFPWKRHTATVTAIAFAVGTEPGWVLACFIWQVDGFWQTQFLALVDVGATRKGKHQRARS